MAVAGRSNQPGITRLLSTINSLVRLRETRGGGRGGAEWLSFNAQTAQSEQPADDAVRPVLIGGESRESPAGDGKM